MDFVNQPRLNRWNTISPVSPKWDKDDCLKISELVQPSIKSKIKNEYNLPGKFTKSDMYQSIISASRANENSADFDVKIIIFGSRKRKSKDLSSAAIHMKPEDDYDINICDLFFAYLTSAIIVDRLDNKIHHFDETSSLFELTPHHGSRDPKSWK